MSRYQAVVSESWNERKRLIRFRRQREHLRFSEEIRLVPRALVMTLIVLLIVAEAVVLTLCYHDFPEPWPIVEEFGLKAGTILSGLIVLAIWAVVACLSCLIAYVNRDAKRRGMNATLWTFLVIVMLPAYLGIGFIFYFTAREPLPYHCPKCGTMVSARYNYCANCQYVLHPTCGRCQQEVGDMDKFCPHCGNDLSAVPAPLETQK